MRKPQIQPSLASLTESDREQLADWLRHSEYKDVLERVNKPRPEGLGLNISEKPLRTFYAKVALFDLINSRLSEDKKLTLATFESLAHGEILLSATADTSKITEAHDAILQTTCDLAKGGDNTPAQLLALQRLADFPERAALRTQREERQAEAHIWKREMQLHKLEMDQFRKQITTERLDLQKRRLQLAEQKLAHDLAKSNPAAPKPQEDKHGPLAHDWEGVRARVRKAFNISEEESARRAALRRAWEQRQPNEPWPPNSLPSTIDNAPASSAVNNDHYPDPGAPSVPSVVPPSPSAPLSVPCGETSSTCNL